jgi:hypothetical protein
MGEGQAPPFIHPYIHPSPTHTRAISASWTEHDRVGNLLDGDPSAMLMSRPDAAALLEVLDFHPPDWRQYYRELFDRFPSLAGRWINVNLWNMPERYPVDQWSIDDDARMREAARARQHADSRMLSEIRALALAVTYRSGTARLQAQRSTVVWPSLAYVPSSRAAAGFRRVSVGRSAKHMRSCEPSSTRFATPKGKASASCSGGRSSSSSRSSLMKKWL